MMSLFRMSQSEEAILISWRLQQWYEGMVLDNRAMQDLQDAIEMLKQLVKQVQKRLLNQQTQNQAIGTQLTERLPTESLARTAKNAIQTLKTQESVALFHQLLRC